MSSDLTSLETALVAEIAAAAGLKALEEVRISALGKKGRVPELMAQLGKLPPEEKKTFGQAVNGLRDRVTVALEPLLTPGTVVYTCGPTPMMRAVAERCVAAGVECQVSMETFMPCGVGICVGCVVGKPDGSFSRACTDGPVYRADEVVW